MKILERLRRLEQRKTESHAAIFYSIYDSVPLGWYYYAEGERVNILRLPDETDDALRARAAATYRAAHPGTQPALLQLDDDRENHFGLIVPTAISPEAWETAAVKQQAELTRGARHGNC